MIRAALNVFRAYGIGELLPPVLTIAVVVPIYLRGIRLSSVGMLVLLGAGFAAVVPLQWLSLRRVYPNAYSEARPSYERKLWLLTSIPLVSVAALQGTTNNMDMLLVGFMRGPFDTGLYGAANRLALQINFILVAVNAIVMPMVSTSYARGDHDRLAKTLHFGVRWTFWPTVLIAGALITLPGPILTVFGSRFAAAAGPLRILAVAGFFGAISGPVGAALAVTGHQAVLARVTLIAFAVGLALEVVLIPTLGITGAAIGDAAQTVFWNGWLYLEVRRRLGVKLYGFV
jgi:O-antigen/teichoic acid export membrane protein